MFIFNVFAAIAVTLAVTTHGAPRSPAKKQSPTKCNGVDVPMSKFTDQTLYVLLTNIPTNNELTCETTIISSKNDHGQGFITDYSAQSTATYSWTSYNQGCLTFVLGPGIPPNTMTFKYFSEEPAYTTAVIFNTLNKRLNSSSITIAIVATVNHIPQAKLVALQQEAISAEPSLSNTTFYSMVQSGCTYPQSS